MSQTSKFASLREICRAASTEEKKNKILLNVKNCAHNVHDAETGDIKRPQQFSRFSPAAKSSFPHKCKVLVYTPAEPVIFLLVCIPLHHAITN